MLRVMLFIILFWYCGVWGYLAIIGNDGSTFVIMYAYFTVVVYVVDLKRRYFNAK